MVELKPLTREVIVAFNGEPFKDSARGLAAYKDGELLGYCGVLQGDMLQAFSHIKPELKKHPKVIVQAAYKMRSLLQFYDQAVYALADENEPTSSRFLEYVGFRYVFDCELGRLYRWQNQ